MLDTLLLALKLISSLLAGIFGAIGTMHDYKDSSGSITKWGRIALFGIVISSAVTITTQVIEEAINQKSAAEASARIEKQIQNQQELLVSVNEQSIRSNKVLGSIQRTFNRIESLSGTFWLELPYTHTAFYKYLKRIRISIDNLLDKPDGDYDIYVSCLKNNPDGSIIPEEVSIPSYSASFPQVKEQPLRRLMSAGLAISIYRKPIMVEQFLAKRWSSRGQPDLQLRMSPDEPKIIVKLEDYHMEVYSRLTTEQQYWDTNGQISSLNDLAESQIWFYVDRPAGFGEDYKEMNAVLSELSSKACIRTIILRINDIDFWFREKDMSRKVASNGEVAWVINMPSDLEAIYERFVKK